MSIQQLLASAAAQGVYLSCEDGQLCFELSVEEFPLQLKADIIDNKADIIAFLMAAAEDQNSFAVEQIVKSTAADENKPLSFAQQRLWFIDQLEQGSPQYNLPCAFKVTGPFDVLAAQQALNHIIWRHESLRTVFIELDNEPVARVKDDVEFSLNQLDLSALSASEQDSEVARFISADRDKVFDLSQDLMLRASYLCLNRVKGAVNQQQQGILVFNMHHIASDGWSFAVLLNEFSDYYQRFLRQQTVADSPLEIQYADYAKWQRNWLQGDVLQTQLDYWMKQLEDMPAVHTLPLDFERPKVKAFAARNVSGQLSASQTQQLQQLAIGANTTLFVVLHAALALLLGRHGNSHDIVIGTPMANRQQKQVEQLIGLFATTQVLRTDTRFETLPEYLQHVRQVNLDAQSYQDVPFEYLTERLNPERSMQYSPLFQILFTLDNNEQGELNLPDLTFTAVDGGEAATKFDLELVTRVSQGQLHISWLFDTSIFTQDHIEQLNQHFMRLLGAIAANPRANITDLKLLSDQELSYLTTQLNQTAEPYDHQALVHQSFETQALQQPTQIALIFEQQQLTYQQLNKKANQLAHCLRQQGVGADTLVGLCLPRSVDMVVAILAILKSGGAYLPIDSTQPQQRIDYIVKDAGLEHVLTYQALAEQFELSEPNQLLALDSEQCQQQLAQYSDENPARLAQQNSSSLAYVIYTSGSTGQPKGVMIEHRAIVNRLDWMQKAWGLTTADRVLQKTPYSFDVSVWEFLWTLGYGATLVVAKPDGHKDPQYLEQLMVAQQVSLLHFVPSMLKAYLAVNPRALPDSVRYVFCSGEALDADSVKTLNKLSPHLRLVNLYGPTEAAIDVTYFDCQQWQPEQSVPIGKPIQNTRLYILNQDGELSPEGTIGELYIEGDGLARGYLNKPQLTNECFIDKNVAGTNRRLYKTGDLVRLLADGNIDYIGRTDAQVKLRGFRIELKEIEYALSQIFSDNAAVKDCLVGVREFSAGEQQLVAWVVCDAPLAEKEEQKQDIQRDIQKQWRPALAARLPEYMIPAQLMLLDEWPLTDSGKVDRKRLPQPGYQSTAVFEAPVGDTEIMLAKVWAQVLDVDWQQISRLDNFFALGGHSLLIIRYRGLLNQQQYDLPMSTLYQNQPLHELATILQVRETINVPAVSIPADCQQLSDDMLPMVSLTTEQLLAIEQSVEGGAANIQDIYPLSVLQKGMLFHALQAAEADPYVQKMLFKCDSMAHVQQFIAAIEFVVARHDALRTQVFHEGLDIPVQVVCRQIKLPTKTISLPAGGLAQGQSIEQWLSRYELPLDDRIHCDQAPMLRLHILPHEGAFYIIFLNHHLIEDNFSNRVLQDEVCTYLAGDHHTLPQVIQYRDFIWQGMQTSEAAAQHFFTEQLAGFSDVACPFGVNGRDNVVASMTTSGLEMQADVVVNIHQLANRLNISMATIVHLAWAAVMSRISNQKDIVFGTVLSGRMQAVVGIEQMVGLCINTLPVRVALAEQTVAQALTATHQQLNHLLAYEQTALVDVQHWSQVPGSTPLFHSILNCRLHQGVMKSQQEAFQTSGIELMFGVEHTNYPLSVSVDFSDAQMYLTIESIAEIDSNKVAHYLAHALTSLTQLARQDKPVGEIDVLDNQDRQFLTQTLNDKAQSQIQEPVQTQPVESQQRLVHQLIAEQASITPDNIAIVYQQQQLTYQALNSAANQLAHHLIELGVSAQMPVGLCLNRSIELFIGILAIFKAGGVYVPLDPAYPNGRLEYMIDDSQIAYLVTTTGLTDELNLNSQLQLINFTADDFEQSLAGYANSEPEINTEKLATPQPDTALAYMIYTSGSTGRPKGVMVEHHCLTAQITAEAEYLALTAQDASLLFASISFDAFAELSYGTLIKGGTLHLPDETVWPLEVFYDYVDQHRITIADIPPAYLAQLLEADVDADRFWQQTTLNRVICGGEAMSARVPERWQALSLFGCCRLINAYGPTEAILSPMLHDINDPQRFTSIGRPFAGRKAYVLDEDMRLLPFGVPGELYLGGTLLARGYHNNPQLTLERFITNPFEANSETRLYKTGDRVRYCADGELTYMGRIDEQIKIRGFRIEPGEIESQLNATAGVASSQVVVQADQQQEKHLVAYLVLETTTTDSEFEAQLRKTLAQTLPAYMIPAAFVQLAQWPLTPNGKIDTKALPPVDKQQWSTEYVAPETPVAVALAEIWAELLHLEVEKISATGNFFELGGHSLLAVRLVSAIKKQFELKRYPLGIKAIFVYPELKAMSEEIELMIAKEHNKQAELALGAEEAVEEGEI